MVTLHAIDVYGKRKQTLVHLPPATTLANAQAFFTPFAPLWDNVSGCFLIEAEVTFPLTKPTGLKTNPNGSLQALTGMLLSFDAGVRNAYGADIPGLKPVYWLGQKDVQESGAGTDIADWIAAYVTGLAGFTPTNGSGEDLTALLRKTRTTHTK